MQKIIVVAGATGNLGGQIVKSLLAQNAQVRALVRSSAKPEAVRALEQAGAKVCTVNAWSQSEIAVAMNGADCVVSALAGLREVVIDAQKVLLDAAVEARVPRFIPTDFSLDFTVLPGGDNRNLDLRREFHTYLDEKPISATSIFNGAFMDMLIGDMPLILFPIKRILCWGDPDTKMDFTTIADTAQYTASAALDSNTPRFLRIAGERKSVREVQAITSDFTGEKYGIFRPGGLGFFAKVIRFTRWVAPGKPDELYPPWQGMQYMHNMMDGRPGKTPLDNERYPMQWTRIADVLAKRPK
jgi:hypothetical protein